MIDFLLPFIVGNLPTWLWPAVFGAGLTIYLLAGILSHLPNLRPYAIFIKPVAFLAMICGVFMYGGAGVAAIYKEQVRELENKVQVAQEQSKTANVQVQRVYVDRVHVVHDTKVVVQEKIKEVEKKINTDCHIDPEVIDILNQAAHGIIK